MVLSGTDVLFLLGLHVVQIKRETKHQQPESYEQKTVGTHLIYLLCRALLGQVCWERYVLQPLFSHPTIIFYVFCSVGFLSIRRR